MDDFRRPRPQTSKPVEDQNKYQLSQANSGASLEAPHSYTAEEGFVAAKASRKIKEKRFPQSLFSHASKKQKVIAGVMVALVVFGGGGGIYAFTKKEKPAPATAPVVQKVEEPPKPTTEPSRLSGIPICFELNKRPVTSIQIENSPDARPQSGLKDAGVVFEAIAEGGITRFNASYLETQPPNIGPVRSVRPYYAVLAAPFDPIFVHAGGSAEGLAKLRELGLKDMDHGANGGAFRRANERFAPHNLYTSMDALDKASQARGYTASAVKGFARKVEQPGQPITARVVDLNISSALYNVHYDYDPANNTYKRVMGGKPHVDQNGGEQLGPKNVVALVMGFSQKGVYSVYQTVGTGKAYVFHDGVVKQASWTKAGEKEQIELKDDAGKVIELNPGQTWFSLVKAANAVTFAP